MTIPAIAPPLSEALFDLEFEVGVFEGWNVGADDAIVINKLEAVRRAVELNFAAFE